MGGDEDEAVAHQSMPPQQLDEDDQASPRVSSTATTSPASGMSSPSSSPERVDAIGCDALHHHHPAPITKAPPPPVQPQQVPEPDTSTTTATAETTATTTTTTVAHDSNKEPPSLDTGDQTITVRDERTRSTCKAFHVLGSIPNASKVKDLLGIQDNEQLDEALRSSLGSRRTITEDVLAEERRVRDQQLLRHRNDTQSRALRRLGIEYNDTDSPSTCRSNAADASSMDSEAFASPDGTHIASPPPPPLNPNDIHQIPADARDSGKAKKLLGISGGNTTKLQSTLGLPDAQLVDRALLQAADSRSAIALDVLDAGRMAEDARLLAENQSEKKALRVLGHAPSSSSTASSRIMKRFGVSDSHLDRAMREAEDVRLQVELDRCASNSKLLLRSQQAASSKALLVLGAPTPQSEKIKQKLGIDQDSDLQRAMQDTEAVRAQVQDRQRQEVDRKLLSHPSSSSKAQQLLGVSHNTEKLKARFGLDGQELEIAKHTAARSYQQSIESSLANQRAEHDVVLLTEKRSASKAHKLLGTDATEHDCPSASSSSSSLSDSASISTDRSSSPSLDSDLPSQHKPWLGKRLLKKVKKSKKSKPHAETVGASHQVPQATATEAATTTTMTTTTTTATTTTPPPPPSITSDSATSLPVLQRPTASVLPAPEAFVAAGKYQCTDCTQESDCLLASESTATLSADSDCQPIEATTYPSDAVADTTIAMSNNQKDQDDDDDEDEDDYYDEEYCSSEED
jgi:hypothetical protein